jgi:hypothetical protein
MCSLAISKSFEFIEVVLSRVCPKLIVVDWCSFVVDARLCANLFLVGLFPFVVFADHPLQQTPFAPQRLCLSPSVVTNMCSCGAACIEQFTQEELAARKLVLSECRTEKAITSWLAQSMIEQASAFGHPKLSYQVNQKHVCVDAFCHINDISPSKLHGIREELYRIGVDQYASKRACYETLHSQVTSKSDTHRAATSPMKFEDIVAWLSLWVERKRVYFNEEGVSCLLDNFTWHQVYEEEFTPSHKSPPSESSFLRAKDHLQQQGKLQIIRPQDHPFCSVCVELNQRLQNSSNSPQVEHCG